MPSTDYWGIEPPKVEPQSVVKPQTVPPYPDEGVAFAGYYKKLSSGGGYEVRPQRVYVRSITFTSGSPNPVFQDTVTGTVYITDIFIDAAAGIVDFMNLWSFNGGTPTVRIDLTNGVRQHISTKTPIPFKDGILYTGVAAGAAIRSLLLVGFVEG